MAKIKVIKSGKESAKPVEFLPVGHRHGRSRAAEVTNAKYLALSRRKALRSPGIFDAVAVATSPRYAPRRRGADNAERIDRLRFRSRLLRALDVSFRSALASHCSTCPIARLFSAPRHAYDRLSCSDRSGFAAWLQTSRTTPQL